MSLIGAAHQPKKYGTSISSIQNDIKERKQTNLDNGTRESIPTQERKSGK